MWKTLFFPLSLSRSRYVRCIVYFSFISSIGAGYVRQPLWVVENKRKTVDAHSISPSRITMHYSILYAPRRKTNEPYPVLL